MVVITPQGDLAFIGWHKGIIYIHGVLEVDTSADGLNLDFGASISNGKDQEEKNL